MKSFIRQNNGLLNNSNISFVPKSFHVIHLNTCLEEDVMKIIFLPSTITVYK